MSFLTVNGNGNRSNTILPKTLIPIPIGGFKIWKRVVKTTSGLGANDLRVFKGTMVTEGGISQAVLGDGKPVGLRQVVLLHSSILKLIADDI